ncbi:hypothetical protein C1H46_002393 [Malus baccata]|uniref:Uncharacterized protein n=1 Tax=Malus baccata TaxID=106549 RepID=A0A540NLT7_MALBA|nr:hypothetical protein C1H46_002393 [Malus baccata]
MKQPRQYFVAVRYKTTSSEYVASRARDPTFEKLMDKYKNLLKVIAVQDLILARPCSVPRFSLQALAKAPSQPWCSGLPPQIPSHFPHLP